MTKTKMLTFIFCVAVCYCTCGFAAVSEEGIVAHYAFDEGAGAILHDRSGNGNDAKIVGPGWVKGTNAAALYFEGTDYVDCGDYSSLHPSGPITLAVWFRTVSNKQQNIIDYYGWRILLIPGRTPVLYNLLSGAWDSMGATSKVPLNKWTSIVVVYDPDRQVQEIYIDGKLSNSKPRTERPWKPGQKFGATKVTLGGRGFTGLIGDARIYTRALSPDEIENLYQEFTIDESLESSQYRFAMKPHMLFREQKIDIELSMTGPRKPSSEQAKPLGAFVTEVTLHKTGKKKVLQQQSIGNLAELKKANVVLSLENIKPGDYEVRASAKYHDGTLLGQESVSVKYPEKPWWFDTQEGKGLDDKVFAPWTPMKVRTDPDDSKANAMFSGEVNFEPKISCWGRTYMFSSDLFPSQIITADRDILAEPVRLVGTVDGREISWNCEKLQMTKNTPARVMLSQKASDAGLKVQVDTQIDYDGMIRMDCHIAALKASTIEKLVFEIPVKREHATLQYQCRDALRRAPGFVPEKGIVRSFNQGIWLGDEERGLQWFTDSDQYWHLVDRNRAIEIMPDGDKVILRLNLVTKPLKLEPGGKTEAISYTFGLQATPVKPTEKDYWDYNWALAHRWGADYAMMTDKIEGELVLDRYARLGVKTVLLFNWTDALSYPLPYRHDKEFRKLVKAIHKRGMKVVTYFGAQYSELAPDFDAFKDNFLGWGSETPYSYGSYPCGYPDTIPTQTVYGPCIRSDWADFMLAGAARLIDEYGVDGIYYDNECSLGWGGCWNPNHPGCGKLTRPDGSSTHAFSVFEGRDFMRRLYHIIKSRKPDGLVDIHPASFLAAPIHAWATGAWDGETILGDSDTLTIESRRGHNLLEYLTLDAFRAQFMGKNWGVPVEFIDCYVPYPCERQFAITLLHDVSIRVHQLNAMPEQKRLEAISPVWKAFTKFGRKEAKWLPYWKNSEYVTAGPDGAYVSLYKHPKNGVLAVVSNLGKEKTQVTVVFALDELCLTDKSTAINALTAEPIPIEKGKVTLDLDSVDWRFVWLKD